MSHLTHMNRHVPVTLLAMYADGTCDLEADRDRKKVLIKRIKEPLRKLNLNFLVQLMMCP